jgi:uncharacterized protein (TIGR02266 family)
LDQEFNKISGDFRAILKAVVQRFKKMVDRASDFSSRQVSRTPKSLSIQFKTPQSFKNAYTGNISPQGLFIRTNNPLGKGEQFSLKMHLPGVADPLKVTCEVVWSKRESSGEENGPAGMGVRFCDLGKKDQETMDAFLDQVLEGA